MNPTLIFDFDGTICDSFTATLRIMNELAPMFGYNLVEEVAFDTLKDQNFNQFKNTLGIATYKIPFVLRRGRKLMHSKITELNPVEGLPSVLRELKNQKFNLGIVTSNSEKNVRAFLAHHSLEIFDFVHGEPGIFGKGRILKKLMRKLKLDPKQVAYVGDEARDIKAAKTAQARSVGVLWGFNSFRLLNEVTPDVILSEPRELIQYAHELRD